MYQVHGTKACEFFQWFDGNDRQKEAISALKEADMQKELDKHNEVICGLKMKIEFLKARIILLVSLLGIAIVFLVGLSVGYVCK